MEWIAERKQEVEVQEDNSVITSQSEAKLMNTENKRVIRYKLLDGSTHDCDYANEEEMFADTEARGLTVISYWIDI